MPENVCQVTQGSFSQSHVHSNYDFHGKNVIATDMHCLQHIKYDFYKKSSELLVVPVYVKQIKDDSLNVVFEQSSLHVRFKTRSNEFLKLHRDASEETVFKWSAKLRHDIDSNRCSYKLSNTKLTLTLRKCNIRDQWNSLEAMRTGGASCPGENSTNFKSARLNCTTSNSLNYDPGNDHELRDALAQNQKSNNQEPCKMVNGGTADNRENSHTNSCGHGKASPTIANCHRTVNGENTGNQGMGNGTCALSNIDEEIGHTSITSSDKTKRGISVHSVDTEKNYRKITADKITDPNAFTRTDHIASENDNSRESRVDKASLEKLLCSSTGNCSEGNSKCRSLTKTSGEKSSANTNKANNELKLIFDANVQKCRPGSTGLVNRANLCYVNSIVQCLSAVRELRVYLLFENYLADINSENKNGFKGDLATCFGSVLQELWSGKKSCVSAMEVKDILGRKHKPFTYFGQGDAQELLTFLLDGLHEDLKVGKMKFSDEKEVEDEKDVLKSGQRHWEKFTRENQSIIVDLFHGQTVSAIRCKECDQPSIRFDPWMQLNLPIPEDPKYLPLYIFFVDPEKKPLQVKIKVCQGTRCADLLIEVEKLADISVRTFVLLRSQHNRISHIFDPVEELWHTPIKETLIACELIECTEKDSSGEEKQGSVFQDASASESGENSRAVSQRNQNVGNADKVLHVAVIQRLTRKTIDMCSLCLKEQPRLRYCSKCFGVAYCNSDCQRNHWKTHRPCCKFQPCAIGFPFVISVLSSLASLSELKKKVLHYARFSVTTKEGELENRSFHLTLLENLADFHNNGKKLVEKGHSPVIDDNVCLALDWECTTTKTKVLSKQLDCEIGPSVNKVASSEGDPCSLEECLKLYWNPETISKGSGWRCDYCKDIRTATRKMTILRHPKNMIIHIKRFSYFGSGRKIRKRVHFPLRGLDMSPYSYNQISASQVFYDLRAVCSHHGVMNFGHYVAYSKPYTLAELNALGWSGTDGWLRYDDSKVTCVSESDAEKTEAYILFYQRRDGNVISCGEHNLPGTNPAPNILTTAEVSSTKESSRGNTNPSRASKSEDQTEQRNSIASQNSYQVNNVATDCESHDLDFSANNNSCSRNKILLEDQLD